MKDKTTVGRAEHVWLVDSNTKNVPARVDTGARTSAIWATHIRESDGVLSYVLFDETSPFYTGEVQTTTDYEPTNVASSNGHIQERYKVPVTIQMRRRRIKTFCTLADRSAQAYPILIGRNTLNGKFIVDVELGSAQLDAVELRRSAEVQSSMKEAR